MKRKIIGALVIVIIIANTVFNINLNTQEYMSSITLKNVEALANAETNMTKDNSQLERTTVKAWLADEYGQLWYVSVPINCCTYNPHRTCDMMQQNVRCSIGDEYE